MKRTNRTEAVDKYDTGKSGNNAHGNRAVAREPTPSPITQDSGFSPYQRGVYTHSPPSALGKVQVDEEPISTMVRMST